MWRRVPAGPDPIRNLGPWTGGPEREVERLRLPYRALLGEQGFVLLYCHVSQLQLEAARAFCEKVESRWDSRESVFVIELNRSRGKARG